MTQACIHADTPRVFRTSALGTTAELVVTEGASLVAASELLECELARIDRVASRFRDDSELSRLNARAGSAVEISTDLLEAIEVALAMAAATDGLVDPTVGAAMTRLGYDRDFCLVASGVDGDLPPAQAAPGWRSVSVDRKRRVVTVPENSALDLGATAKALAADRAASTIHRRLGCGTLVSLGGDAAAAGPAPAGGVRHRHCRCLHLAHRIRGREHLLGRARVVRHRRAAVAARHAQGPSHRGPQHLPARDFVLARRHHHRRHVRAGERRIDRGDGAR